MSSGDSKGKEKERVSELLASHHQSTPSSMVTWWCWPANSAPRLCIHNIRVKVSILWMIDQEMVVLDHERSSPLRGLFPVIHRLTTFSSLFLSFSGPHQHNLPNLCVGGPRKEKRKRKWEWGSRCAFGVLYLYRRLGGNDFSFPIFFFSLHIVRPSPSTDNVEKIKKKEKGNWEGGSRSAVAALCAYLRS